jgi:hypothetical protein
MKRFGLILVFGLSFSILCFAQSQTGNASYNSSRTGFFISHPSLSFNTKVLVTNLSNNLSVEAAVNGRIPITADRIADIFRDTGDAIKMPPDGMTLVRIEKIQPVFPPEAPEIPVEPVVLPEPVPVAPAVLPEPVPVAVPPAPVPAAAPPPAPAPAPAPVSRPPAVLPAAVVVPEPAPPAPSPVPALAPAPAPVPVMPVRIITEEEYAAIGCPAGNCANTPLLVAILILLILVIALLVVIIIMILHWFPFLPKNYRIWLRRHVLYVKRLRK